MSLCLIAACAVPEAERADVRATAAVPDTAHPWRKPRDRIDSILPMEEYLRRFRRGLTEPARLEGGEATRDALARTFLAAVAHRDTGAFGHLLVSREEFAWLVFPDHLYSRPPYELDPEVFWMRLSSGNAKGLRRTLQRLGAQQLTFQALDCRRDTLQITRGPVRIWSSCGIRFRAGDSVVKRRLFGSMVERDGRVKLMSFANDF